MAVTAMLTAPLTDSPGDPARGRAVIASRESTCLLCHSGPFPEVRFQGDIAPSLSGVGGRLDVAEIRERVAYARRLNPDGPMPSYFETDGLSRVGAAWKGKPILTAQQIEDVVAYLATLKAP